MNLIYCDEPCQHQKEGYCTLHSAAPVSLQGNSRCPYFEKMVKSQPIRIIPSK